MKKLILPSMITFFFITGIEVHADGHASNNGEGAFNTLMVKSKDIEKYVARLKSDQTVFKAIGTSDAGVCITRSGNNHEGEMFVWNAYPDVATAMHANTIYNPYDAPKEMKKLRKVKYGVTWRPLKSFRLDPGWERVIRVKVESEDMNAYVQTIKDLEKAIIDSGYPAFNMGVFVPIGGGTHESETLMIRAIMPTAKEFGELVDNYFKGASWGRIWEQSQMMSEVTSDTFEECEQIYKAK